MTAITNNESRVHSTPILVVPRPSTKEIESRVASIKAENIATLANTMAELILYSLNIDVQPSIPTGKPCYQLKEDGTEEFRGIEQIFDKNWIPSPLRKELVEIAIPLITEELTETFSLSTLFVKEGKRFPLFSKKPIGILQQIFKQKEFVPQWHPQEDTLTLILELDPRKAQERDILHFCLYSSGQTFVTTSRFSLNA